MIFTRKSMEDLLVNSKVAISNALSDEEIKKMLLNYSYSDETLNEGIQLYCSFVVWSLPSNRRMRSNRFAPDAATANAGWLARIASIEVRALA